MTGIPRTVFLFGAGASYGSDTQGTPPLGADLFEELRRFNPDAWGSISGDLAERFRSDFEEGMKSVPSRALAPLQRAMAAYFFDFKPRTSSLYVELVRRSMHAELRASFRGLFVACRSSTVRRSGTTRGTGFRALPAARLLPPIL